MIDWDGIVGEHGSMVWRTAFRLLGRVEDAQDCLQDTFLSALKVSRRQRVRNWPAMLRRLATSRALDRLRRRVRRGRLHEDDTDVEALARPHGRPDEDMQAAELSGRLREALAELPDRQAEVFALHFFEQMPHGQVADALGLKANAVGVLLHQARRRLRVLLKEGCDSGVER